MRKIVLSLLLLMSISSLKSQFANMLNKTFQLDSSSYNEFYNVFKHDSSFYIFGFSSRNYNSVLLKLDNSAQITKRVNINDSVMTFNNNYTSAIQSDQGIVIASNKWGLDTAIYGVILSFDYNLDTLFYKRYNANVIDPTAVSNRVLDIVQTPDNGFIVSGCYYWDTLLTNYSSFFPYLMKLNPSGDIQWVKPFGDYHFSMSSFVKIHLTPDLGLLLLSTKNGGSIIKTNALGEVQWITNHPNDSVFIAASDMVHSGSNSFMIASSFMKEVVSASAHHATLHYGMSLLSINYVDGTINWHKRHTPIHSFADPIGFSLHKLNNGTYVASSTAIYYGTILYLDELGITIYFNSLGDIIDSNYYRPFSPNYQSRIYNTIIEPQGNIIGVGRARTDLSNYNTHGWIFRTNSNGFLNTDDKMDYSNSLVKVYPVPSKDLVTFNISPTNHKSKLLSIYNSSGIVINQFNILKRDSNFEFDVDKLPPGLYIWALKSEKGIIDRGKFIVL